MVNGVQFGGSSGGGGSFSGPSESEKLANALIYQGMQGSSGSDGYPANNANDTFGYSNQPQKPAGLMDKLTNWAMPGLLLLGGLLLGRKQIGRILGRFFKRPAS